MLSILKLFRNTSYNDAGVESLYCMSDTFGGH